MHKAKSTRCQSRALDHPAGDRLRFRCSQERVGMAALASMRAGSSAAFAENLGVRARRESAVLHFGHPPIVAGARSGPGGRGRSSRTRRGSRRAAPISYVGRTRSSPMLIRKRGVLTRSAFKAGITTRTQGSHPGGPVWRDARLWRNRAVAGEPRDSRSSRMLPRPSGLSLGRAGQLARSAMTGVFSFHGSKTLTTGEGGMLVTDSDDLVERVRVLRDPGRQPGDTMFRNRKSRYKYKMSWLQAALGLAQLERLDELVETQATIFEWYREELGLASLGIPLNSEPVGSRIPTGW